MLQKIGKELLKELSKVPRVLENLNKIINGLDKKSSYPRNDLTDTWIFHLGTVNDKFQSSLGRDPEYMEDSVTHLNCSIFQLPKNLYVPIKIIFNSDTI